MRLLRFRRFGTRLLALILGLLFAALGATWWFVARANQAHALATSETNLAIGSDLFDDTIRQRVAYLAANARGAGGDYAFKSVLQSDEPDAATLASALESYARRVGSPLIGYFDADCRLLANSNGAMDNENAGPFAYLIRLATDHDMDQADGFAYLHDNLHVLVVVPNYAPRPVVAGWFGVTFPIDRDFAAKLKLTTRLEVTFVRIEDGEHPRVLATTLPAADAAAVAAAAARHRAVDGHIELVDQPGGRHVTYFKMLDLLGDAPVAVVLQRPLRAELAAARALAQEILFIAAAALGLATLAALALARGVSEPVRRLAAHTKLVAAGDYTTRVALDHADEFGQLATDFNAMSAGLAERDRIRDLLDKNVSPAVAAQLLRDGATLGGEEREVTILFADLRAFTTLSESLPPRELLALLNRYLDRMSAEIERQGGVIDKFIGDAIMALFGAPVAQGDAPARALATARAMVAALAALNAELAAEGRAPLALGIGLNTARVVAGNIGSQRRLNYSVIGDGVNVAARLQSLTRTVAYRTDILASAATIAAAGAAAGPTRPLGAITVKGRTEPVEILAVD